MRFEDNTWYLADTCSASGEPITDRSLVDDQIDVEIFSLKGRMATSCARCGVTVSTRLITESQC